MRKTLRSTFFRIVVIVMSIMVMGVAIELIDRSYGNPIRLFSTFINSLFASVFSNWRTSSYQFELGIILIVVVIAAVYLIFRGIFFTYKK